MSTQYNGPDDSWAITGQDDGGIIVWCGVAGTDDGRRLNPDEAQRMASQLLRAAGPPELLPMPLLPGYDRTPDLRIQALDMAIRLVPMPSSPEYIVTFASKFEQYLRDGKVDSEQGE